jgi:hypothetical protein
MTVTFIGERIQSSSKKEAAAKKTKIPKRTSITISRHDTTWASFVQHILSAVGLNGLYHLIPETGPPFKLSYASR